MHEPIDSDVYEFNVSLTVPGPELSVAEMRAMWLRFSQILQRSKRSAVWRLEVQKRGAVHWHMIVHTPRRVIGDLPPVVESGMNIPDMWRKALDSLGPCVHRCKWWDGKESTYEFQSRSDIPWAFDIPEWAVGKKDARSRAVDVQRAPDSQDKRWTWRRYMQDHASKAKQEQIADGIGRHWGVIGKKLYKAVVPSSMQSLSDGQYFAVIRWMQRMVSGTIRADKAPFGRKRGTRRHRGTHGSSVWFSRPAVVARMIDLAKTIRADDPAGM